MQRDMSYELDDIFSTRNAGELVSEQIVKTRVLRTPGLRVLSLPEDTSIPRLHSTSLAVPESTAVTDLAGDITLPVIGPVSTTKLAIGAGLGLLAWFVFFRK